jgi:UDP-N-acetylglucosamine diphosphorylase / glucose-1-phosphate thymidylyltransferase / UDP-N-acetylgalactosamine diphosphorylase / glucosamine-1-phosphate N-acetyltransferase / galactosamine-1-phosphate N-acetyltransferase
MLTPTPVVLFDDGHGITAPLTDLRASFMLRTGALTTLERLRRMMPNRKFRVWTRASVEAITRETTDLTVNEPAAGLVLLLNGRCPLPPAIVHDLQEGEGLIDEASGDLIATLLQGEAANALILGGRPAVPRAKRIKDAVLISRPWHIRTHRDACIKADLALMLGDGRGTLPAGVVTIGEGKISLSQTAKVYPAAVFDVEQGPIVIDHDAVIRPGAQLIGPCYVGPHATILERATIRPFTAIGPWCKVNGEVAGSIFQGFANKAHDGYLGDSYVGEWVNLGAGTTNSNLLNTYGETISQATPGGKHERTGEQFLGAIIGDHVKTAICMRIMTASVLHTGGMFATTSAVSGCTPPFAWATDAGTKSYRFEKFLEVVHAQMSRRKLTPSAAYIARLKELAALNTSNT